MKWRTSASVPSRRTCSYTRRTSGASAQIALSRVGLRARSPSRSSENLVIDANPIPPDGPFVGHYQNVHRTWYGSVTMSDAFGVPRTSNPSETSPGPAPPRFNV
jgi:hypothetical protein